VRPATWASPLPALFVEEERRLDLTATILHKLGVAPRTTIRDPQGRQVPLSEGKPIAGL
jgi:hypothetical protein